MYCEIQSFKCASIVRKLLSRPWIHVRLNDHFNRGHGEFTIKNSSIAAKRRGVCSGLHVLVRESEIKANRVFPVSNCEYAGATQTKNFSRLFNI